MKLFFYIFLFFALYSCSIKSSVLICGDHICINKKEARQFFEENMTIEVKIIDKFKQDEINLVELNLQKDHKKNNKIRVFQKERTNKEIKPLTKEEIIEIKKKIKKKYKKKEIVKINKTTEKDVNKNSNQVSNKEIVDICSILDKCNINEITKYLIKQGRKKDFPDITSRN